jgi:hypothetical protein
VKRFVCLAVVAVLLVVPASPASASLGAGLQYLVAGVFEPVRQTLAGTFGGPPILGTAFGLLGGTLRGALMVTRGALELIPVAAKLAPLIPVFL